MEVNFANAQWWGGFYERLIKGVKLRLKKNIRESRPSYDQMQKTISQIDGVLKCKTT